MIDNILKRLRVLERKTNCLLCNKEGSGGGGGSGPKVYRAMLTQSGTADPVATVLENTLGGDIVWTRVNAGIYNGTLTGAFTENKTHVLYQNKAYDHDEGGNFLVRRVDADTLIAKLYADDNSLNDEIAIPVSINILVYP